MEKIDEIVKPPHSTRNSTNRTVCAKYYTTLLISRRTINILRPHHTVRFIQLVCQETQANNLTLNKLSLRRAHGIDLRAIVVTLDFISTSFHTISVEALYCTTPYGLFNILH